MSKRDPPEVTPFDDAKTALDKLRGNWTPDSVTEALIRISDQERGRVAVGPFQEGAPAEVLRAALEMVWEHNHAPLWKACGGRKRKITRFFRVAEFDNDHLPEVFDIWRGGVGRQSSDWHGVASGISWTRSRGVACWFALGPSGSWIKGEPVVLKRTIERRDVLAHFTGRDEDEIVTTTVGPTVVDGSLEDWRSVAEDYQNKLMAERKARLKAIARRRRLRQSQ
jgi:hypothetical protein